MNVITTTTAEIARLEALLEKVDRNLISVKGAKCRAQIMGCKVKGTSRAAVADAINREIGNLRHMLDVKHRIEDEQ